MMNFAEALIASLMVQRRNRDGGRRNEVLEDLRAARERQTKRS